MAPLSNPSGFSDGFSPGSSFPDSAAQIRRARKQEVEPAIRLILTGRDAAVEQEHVVQFMSFALQREIDLSDLWVVCMEDRLIWAVLPIYSPGKTVLLLVPGICPRGGWPVLTGRLLDHVCARAHQSGAELAQILLPVGDTVLRDGIAGSGFRMIGELRYLQRQWRKPPPSMVLPQDVEVVDYGPSTHVMLAETLQRTYEGSLDCPTLNGLRHVEDIIAGHKSAGVFNPGWWKLLCRGGKCIGLVLLCGVPQTTTMELVYLGLAPEARGQGLGDVLMRLAVDVAVQAGCDQLTLAVDSGNSPALGLYHRHGLRHVGTRIAMLRDLRVMPAAH